MHGAREDTNEGEQSRWDIVEWAAGQIQSGGGEREMVSGELD